MLDRRGRQLRVALWFLELRPAPADAALATLRSWLDSWMGIGAVTAGMAHQGYDLQLTRYDARGWRATFYASGIPGLRPARQSGWASLRSLCASRVLI